MNMCGNLSDGVGLLERMKAGEFDLDMVDYSAPDPPDIDQMKKDELYALQPPGSG